MKRFFAVLLLLTVAAIPVSAAADSIVKVFNYPNPFQPSAGGTTQICFRYVSVAGSTSLEYYVFIYNLVGHRVYVQKRTATLSGATTEQPVEFTWNGRTDKGGMVPPGIYYIRIVTQGGQSLSKYGKMMIK